MTAIMLLSIKEIIIEAFIIMNQEVTKCQSLKIQKIPVIVNLLLVCSSPTTYTCASASGYSECNVDWKVDLYLKTLNYIHFQSGSRKNIMSIDLRVWIMYLSMPLNNIMASSKFTSTD